MGEGEGDFLLSTGNSVSNMDGQYVAVIERLFSSARIAGCQEVVYFWIDLVQFVKGIVVPLNLPEFSNVIAPAWFQIREGDVFV